MARLRRPKLADLERVSLEGMMEGCGLYPILRTLAMLALTPETAAKLIALANEIDTPEDRHSRETYWT